MNKNPIGILDSGVGGLSVWKEVAKLLPNESFIYLADSKNAPYGPREPREIVELASALIRYLLRNNVKLIIVACNTITVSGIDSLRYAFPEIPIIGTVPVIKTAAAVTKNKKIGVFSTTRTAESIYQKNLIKKFAQDCEVISVGSDIVVPLIEKGIVSGENMDSVLREALLPLKDKGIDTLAIACTHYPFIEREIRKILGEEIQLLEPSAAVARHAKHILERNQIMTKENTPTYLFYTTGDASEFATVATKLLGSTIQAEHVLL